MKKIAVLTSGGDAQGMNAAIYGIFGRAQELGYELYHEVFCKFSLEDVPA